ncbi:MAG: phosphoribosylformylglycinamidine synthase subunit PurQ [Planctomycetota bacterium]
MPTALIITTAGTNCDRELARAFALAGATPEFVHVNALRRDLSIMDRAALIGLPGGFSYGDAIAAGRVQAQLLRAVYPAFRAAIERGVPIIAPCNGFQVAVQLGLLPGPDAGMPWPDEPLEPVAALAQNAQASFVDRWARIEVPADTRCVWTRGLRFTHDTNLLPVAHGEGRFVVASAERLRQLRDGGQVAVTYHADDNPNGSMDSIAGICDASGLVFGLMPHPERYTRWTQHPWWTRLEPSSREHEPPGLRMFRQAVAHAAGVEVAT